jgi:hypothetical protein
MSTLLFPLAAAALLAGAENSSTPPPGFTPLFDGKTLAGWYGWSSTEKGKAPADLAKLSPGEVWDRVNQWTADAAKHWTIENGELVNDGKGAYLASVRTFADYELLIDYKTVPKADSGIYLKAAPQVQIWDTTDEAKFKLGADKGSGGLWNNSAGATGKDPLVKADKPFGEWNRFRIVQVGERTTIYLNDQLVVKNARLENYFDRTKPLPVRGPVVLQTHGGEIRWRNVFVKELTPAEANAVLLADADGFTPAFNGTDLTGWAGAVNDYEVKDGAIVCKPGKGGNLFTERRFADFVARVEYQLPPGGNNGLLIRYPGGETKADGAYSGLCEVQVLDDTAAKYAGKLDPRQYNGSLYGMVPAVQGYLRPVGQWNVMEVTVQGSRVTVELNGSRITDADLGKVKEFMGNRPHPGLKAADGHFGFAGHTDPVRFRTVHIKELK